MKPSPKAKPTAIKATQDRATAPVKESEMWPLSRFVPYARNPRKNDEAVDRMAASIREFGFKIPVLVRSSGEIVDGHLRLKAAQKLELSEIPVLLCDEWSEAQVKAFRLLVNRSVSWADWDDQLLGLEMVDLQAIDYDLSLTGFDSDEVKALLKQTAVYGAEEEETPEPPASPVSVLGDLWLLGEHRVLCGDSTDADSVSRLLDGGREDAIVTDPPYGVGVDYGSFEDSRQNVATLIAKIVPRILQAPCAVLTPGIPSMWLYPQPAWVLAWVHPAAASGCQWGFAGVNPILAYGKDPYLAAGLGRRADHLVSASDSREIHGHPVPKPLTVWKWLVERVAPKAGSIVLDLFGGSGTTLVACESLGHLARLMELEPRYVDVIVTRWQKFSGKQATLESDGRTFDAVKQDRAPASCTA